MHLVRPTTRSTAASCASSSRLRTELTSVSFCAISQIQFGTRIELRQMGHRDETKLRGGYGCCGVEVCCHRFLREPKPVPMEYAYDQELFVSPERITGCAAA